MKIILIANNTNINENTIDKININENDLLVLFNTQLPLKFNKIKNHKNKILFLRAMGQISQYHGFDEYTKYKDLYKNTFFVSSKFII